ncbi:MAG: hypothetical protein NW226_22875 [Microscillaceae bacterium]|nr:hypothetical protein [Microscillaceae bacterium]
MKTCIILLSLSLGLSVHAQEISFKRFETNPIITPEMLGEDGGNINGPSLIKAPDWLTHKLGKYYLYFAHHQGQYIRLAYSNDLKGPWKIYQPGSLKTTDCRCKNAAGIPSDPNNKGEVYLSKPHIASPDVHIDHTNKQLVMYFHCPLNNQGKKGQYTLRAISNDGIHFTADTTILGESYFKVFEWKGTHYAIARAGQFYKSTDRGLSFEEGPNPFDKLQTEKNYLRHAAIHIQGDDLWIFYSKIGDKPESILLSKIKWTPNWNEWTPTEPALIAEPTTEYEGANLPLTVSRAGSYHGLIRELRDPAFYEENEKWYLLYSVGGEYGIGIAELK